MKSSAPDLTVTSRPAWLNLLTNAIQIKHHCHAVHIESVRVIEQHWGERIWEGNVQVFALVGHAGGNRCYAWVETPAMSQYQFVTVLQKGLVISPETAVRGWLASKHVTVETPFQGRLDSQIISQAEYNG